MHRLVLGAVTLMCQQIHSVIKGKNLDNFDVVFILK